MAALLQHQASPPAEVARLELGLLQVGTQLPDLVFVEVSQDPLAMRVFQN